MGTITEILAQHEEKKRSALRDRWREYRHLLEQSLCGTLTSDGADRIAELTTELRLTPAEAEAHCQSLTAHAAMLSKQRKIDPLKKQIADLDPQIETLSARRAELLAQVDAELQPLLHRSATMNHELASLQNAVEWGRDRETAKFKFLYGAGFDAPPPPRAQPTAAQQEESRRRSEHFGFFVRVRASLLTGVPRDLRWGDAVQSAITMCFAYGIESHPDAMVFTPEGGWPTLAQGYHPGVAADPRKKKIIKLAKELHRDNTNPDDFGRVQLSIGREMGWLDRYNVPIATAEAISDEEVDATE